MTDNVDKKTRSRVMSTVRSKGNKSTERRLRAYLAQKGISGWRMHDKQLPGKPDFVFDDIKLAIFIDGCFWHYCPKCCRLPKSNTEYWHTKIAGNRERDRKNTELLRADGWRVARIWEHALRTNPAHVMSRIRLIINLSVRAIEQANAPDEAQAHKTKRAVKS